MYQEGSINIPNPLMKDDEKTTLPDIKTLRFSQKWNAVCPAHWKEKKKGGGGLLNLVTNCLQHELTISMTLLLDLCLYWI